MVSTMGNKTKKYETPYLISLAIFIVACTQKEQKQANSFTIKTVKATGYVVPKDSMAEPVVIHVDESKLKKIPVGTPKVINTNLNVHPVGNPKVNLAGNPKIITPGTDTFSLPKVVPAIDSPFVAKQPKAIPALPFRMKDAATCNMQYLDVDQGMNSSYVFSILEDKSGNLWFGTYGGGVSKYDGKSFTHYTDKEGLSNNTVWSILEDKSGNLWFGTEKGLSCFVVRGGGLSTTKLQNGEDKFNPQIVVFHKEDGLKAEDFFQNSVLLDSKNRVWWGSGKALSMIDLNEFELDEKEPQIQLDNIYLQENFVDYRSLKTETNDSVIFENEELKKVKFTSVADFFNYPKELELPYYLNHLTFYFSAIDWYAPHKIKYQYKLEGLDPEWSNLTADNKADYRNIPYGKYTFKVRAIGSAGKWSKTFEYSFEILPPWWRTWWAYTLYALLAVTTIISIVWWNGRRLRARAEELKIKVDEATIEIKEQKHLIEEKHKEITDSIKYAERIQRSFLASREMLDENLGDYFVFFKPKDVVSGDFYWAAQLQNNSFAFAVADSTGHGVPGAIMSILNISSLEKSIETQTEPHHILSETRKIIINRLKKDGSPEGGKDGMDCSLLVLNQDKTQLSFASAHNPVFILRTTVIAKEERLKQSVPKDEIASLPTVVRNDGYELIEFKGDKIPVGKHDRENEPFTLHTITLQKGDVIYALTDGFPDQFGGDKGKKFKIKNLKELLLQIAHLPMCQQEQKLAEEFARWKGSNEQVDDVCMIGVRV